MEKLKITINTFGAGNFIHKDDKIIHYYEDDIYIDVRSLKGLSVGINNLGIDKATRRKYLKNYMVKEFYENNILFPLREKLHTLTSEDYFNTCVYIYCHQGKHKSVCLAEQLYIDLKKLCKVDIEHLDIDNENNDWKDEDSWANYFLKKVENNYNIEKEDHTSIGATYEITLHRYGREDINIDVVLDVNHDSYWTFLKYMICDRCISKLKQGSSFNKDLNLNAHEQCGSFDYYHGGYNPKNLWKYIVPALERMTSIKYLDLSSNFEIMSLDDYRDIVPALKKMKELKKINLTSSIGYQELKILIPALKEMKKLKELDLTWNGFGFEGLKLLADVLPQMKSLKYLYLAGTKIGDDGCKELVNILESLENIKRLFLAENNITRNGFILLIPVLKKKKNLRYINLDNNKLGEYLCRDLPKIFPNITFSFTHSDEPLLEERAYAKDFLDDVTKIFEKHFINK